MRISFNKKYKLRVKNKIKLRNFGDFKSGEFLYSQIHPQLSSIDSVVDIGGEYKVETQNITTELYRQSFKTYYYKQLKRLFKKVF